MCLKVEQEILSDEQVNQVHLGSDFGCTSKRDVVRFAVLKCASGLTSGSTAEGIILKNGLITTSYRLTRTGQKYLWAAFGRTGV